jgi:hypothetical protein
MGYIPLANRGYGFCPIPAHRRQSAGQVVYSRPTPRTREAAVDIGIGIANTLLDTDENHADRMGSAGGGARLLQTS